MRDYGDSKRHGRSIVGVDWLNIKQYPNIAKFRDFKKGKYRKDKYLSTFIYTDIPYSMPTANRDAVVTFIIDVIKSFFSVHKISKLFIILTSHAVCPLLLLNTEDIS